MNVFNRLFWVSIFIGSVVEYLYLRRHTTAAFAYDAGVVLALACVCIVGFVITRTIIAKGRASTCSAATAVVRDRSPARLVPIYSFLALIFVVVNLVPVFTKTNYTGRDTIFSGMNTVVLTISAVVLVTLGTLMTIRRK